MLKASVHSDLSRADGRAIGGAQPFWGRVARIARLGLGGCIVGSFIGVYAGAVLGLIYGAWVADLSPALDAALVGGVASALFGGGYGIVLGLTEWRGRAPAASPDRDNEPLRLGASLPESRPIASTQTPPAGRLEADGTPELEHVHVR